MLYFITGNKNKFEEVKAILNNIEIEQLDIDLPEIQEIDSRKIIEAKLQEAKKHQAGEFMVEDASLSLDCLGGLPGPMIKWFEKAVGIQGIADLAGKMGGNKAKAAVTIGHADANGNIAYFDAVLQGIIVQPKGDKDFGWGPIFQPEGQTKTFGEMERGEKHALSMRGVAARKLRDYLEAK